MPRVKATTSLDERLEKAIDALGETISQYRPKLGTGIHSDYSPTPLELWNATPECRGLSFRYYRHVWQQTMQEYFPTMVYIKNTGEWLDLGGGILNLPLGRGWSWVGWCCPGINSQEPHCREGDRPTPSPNSKVYLFRYTFGAFTNEQQRASAHAVAPKTAPMRTARSFTLWASL